jgi:hypothetical protein
MYAESSVYDAALGRLVSPWLQPNTQHTCLAFDHLSSAAGGARAHTHTLYTLHAGRVSVSLTTEINSIATNAARVLYSTHINNTLTLWQRVHFVLPPMKLSYQVGT